MAKHIHNIKYWKIFFFIAIQLLLLQKVFSQPNLPARSVTVIATQALHFGAFCLTNTGSSGGTVTVDWQGVRSSTGDIILLSTETYQPAIFEIQLCQGRNVTITYSPFIILTGSNGGSLTLLIGPTEKGVSGSSFAVSDDCNFITPLRVGGTLSVLSNLANPGGTYTGNFSITFNQQ